MSGYGVVVDDEAFLRGLRDAMSKLKLRSEDDLKRLAIRVQNEARSRAPVDTGRLRSSIQAGQIQRDDLGAFIEVGTNVEYAGFVEFGTRYMSARPYMRPALLAAARAGMR